MFSITSSKISFSQLIPSSTRSHHYELSSSDTNKDENNTLKTTSTKTRNLNKKNHHIKILIQI